MTMEASKYCENNLIILLIHELDEFQLKVKKAFTWTGGKLIFPMWSSPVKPKMPTTWQRKTIKPSTVAFLYSKYIK